MISLSALSKFLPQPARRVLKTARDRLSPRACQAYALQRARRPRRGKRHNRSSDLIVSLTSYPARFRTLHLTLACLLDQTVRPDRVILWIADADLDRLPQKVRQFEQAGLEIMRCADLRSFKKLIPALGAFPDAFIATADDDVYYPANWLEELVGGVNGSTITCHRAHRPTRRLDGKPARYLDWDFEVQDEAARAPSADIVPTSGAGALYPPRCLHPMVTDRTLFEALCPDGDDLWFYWCARRAGTRFRKVGGQMRLISWLGSQDSSLWDVNSKGGNDRMIAALQAKFPLDWKG